MQLIEAALAFAITMLALSLVVSSFVEIIHRIFSMREAGLKYVLGQMFDQVAREIRYPGDTRAVEADDNDRGRRQERSDQELVADSRMAFVERMSANRAPMGGDAQGVRQPIRPRRSRPIRSGYSACGAAAIWPR
jgi:hypothetical protein